VRTWRILQKRKKLRSLEGFGKRAKQNILKAVEVSRSPPGRFHLNTAEDAAEKIIATYQKGRKSKRKGDAGGRCGDGKADLGDWNLLVTLGTGTRRKRQVDALAKYLKYPGTIRRWTHGENTSEFTLPEWAASVCADCCEKENSARRGSISPDRRNTSFF